MPKQRPSKADKPTEDELLGWHRIIMGEHSPSTHDEPVASNELGELIKPLAPPPPTPPTPTRRLPTTKTVACWQCGTLGEHNLVSGNLTVNWLRVVLQVSAHDVEAHFYCSVKCLAATLKQGDLG